MIPQEIKDVINELLQKIWSRKYMTIIVAFAALVSFISMLFLKDPIEEAAEESNKQETHLDIEVKE